MGRQHATIVVPRSSPAGGTGRPRTRIVAALAVALVAAGPAGPHPGASSGVAAAPEVGDATIFATVPDPGHPEGVVVDGDVVHVTTTAWLAGLVTGDGVPSHVFTFDRATGERVDDVVVLGERTDTFHGVGGIVLDGHGNRYATVNPYPHPDTGDTAAAVVRFAPDGTQEAYALVPDLAPCAVAAAPCSPTAEDRAPLANDLVFDADGNLYVSDSFQATVWRVPPGGGMAEPWLQDADLDGLPVGPNGTRIHPDGTHLVLAVMANLGHRGSIVTIPLGDAPTMDQVEVLHAWTGESPDGITYGASGRLWVVLGGGALVALDADGVEVERISSELFHGPASPAFDDATRSILVTNHAFDDPDPDHQTIVRVFVDDVEVPMARPCLEGRAVVAC